MQLALAPRGGDIPQAFSTPRPLTRIVGRAGGPSSADLVLEPSAGTGLPACSAGRVGCHLLLNEIDPDRRHMVRWMKML